MPELTFHLVDLAELPFEQLRRKTFAHALLARYLQYFITFTENLDMPAFQEKIKLLPDSPMKTKGLPLAQQFIAAGREEGIYYNIYNDSKIMWIV